MAERATVTLATDLQARKSAASALDDPLRAPGHPHHDHDHSHHDHSHDDPGHRHHHRHDHGHTHPAARLFPSGGEPVVTTRMVVVRPSLLRMGAAGRLVIGFLIVAVIWVATLSVTG
ncbi:hypothetical protein [Chthonobacter albigriseus]|uniref:hypothetical protein n=1 Tax=Chthonobacter albigriseus TaxID=1683161 RepID=UPI0015EE595A|nr:hypothetical protein [Chthonobacter albigriseus]